MNFSTLNFGAPAAERDIDRGLKEYFVESETFNKFINREKSVLIGNRGSGKSAIFKILAERYKQQGYVVLELSPEDYSYEILNTTMAKESAGAWAKQGAYAVAWKYLIYVMIMKKINKKGRQFKVGASANIYKYLRDNHKDEQANPIAIMISYLKRLEGFKIGSYEASIKSKELAKLYQLEEIEKLLPDLFEICKKLNVVVLIDELDKGWDKSEDAIAYISGLFQAAMSINERSEYIRVYISLRRELYDSIPAIYEDAQKYRDIMEVIKWDEESLLNLIANRIRYSVDDLSGYSDIDTWNIIFSEILDYRQTKSFNYMIDRTLYRPREIIQFCTEVIDKKNTHDKFPLNYSVISLSENIYSESRTQDIAAEYKFQWTGLASILEAFRGKSFNLIRVELEEICLSLSTGEIKVIAEAKWIMDQDPDFIIEILWRIGFIKAQAVGGIKAYRRSGSQYIGSHQISNLNLSNIKRFHIHPMFRSYLGLKESKDSR